MPQASLGYPAGPQKVALVTGANKGIGKEIARKLSSADQCTTVILGCRSEDLGASCAEELRAAGCDAIVQRLDLNDSSSIVNTFEFIQEVYGGRSLRSPASVLLSILFIKRFLHFSSLSLLMIVSSICLPLIYLLSSSAGCSDHHQSRNTFTIAT